jgi:hypothetical protein
MESAVLIENNVRCAMLDWLIISNMEEGNCPAAEDGILLFTTDSYTKQTYESRLIEEAIMFGLPPNTASRQAQSSSIFQHGEEVRICLRAPRFERLLLPVTVTTQIK